MKFEVNFTWKTLVKTTVVIGLMLGAFFFGAVLTVPTAFKQGYDEGYVKALGDIKAVLGEKGITFSWRNMGNGQYLLSVLAEGKLYARGTVEVHMHVWHYRNGELLSYSYHDGVLSNGGMNYIEGKLGNSAFANNTKFIQYIGTSENSATPLPTWVAIPDEITDSGLQRQLASYVDDGIGAWNTTYTFNVGGSKGVQLYGFYWDTYADGRFSLGWADTSAVKNVLAGDTLKVTGQQSVS